MTGAFDDLERNVRAALCTYANVHRGSGHKSQVSTHLYETARALVLAHLGLPARSHMVVFASPRRCEALTAHLDAGEWRCVSSEDLGLPLGLRAVAAPCRALRRITGLPDGGGTARLVGPDWVVPARLPERLEAGTPAVINAIALACALRIARTRGPDALSPPEDDPRSARDVLHHDAWDALAGPELLAALRATLIGRELPVPTRSGSRPHVNLDHGASTPAFEPVWDAVRFAWRQGPERRRELVRETRAVCAEFLHAPQEAYETIFTANTTEAIHRVAESLAPGGAASPGTVVLNTLLEHNSNELPWRTVPGVSRRRLPFDGDGFVDPAELERLLRDVNVDHRDGDRRIRLVAVSGASNVLGTFNDLSAIARLAHRYGAQVLVDAAQLVAHRPVDMAADDIDYLVFSAHKAYAPFGTGALVARRGLLALPEAARASALASGDENVVGIAALGKALVLLRRIGLDVVQRHEQALTARLLQGLAGLPRLKVHGLTDPASPRFVRKGGVVPFEVKGMLPTRVARELCERRGIGIRFGCHCAHLTVKHFLRVPPWAESLQRFLVRVIPSLNLPGVDRVSFGLENREEDVDAVLSTLADIAARAPLPKADMKRELREFSAAAAGRVFPS